MTQRTLSGFAAIVLVTGTLAMRGEAVVPTQPFGRDCSNATLRGTYGVQMQGTRPVPPALGGGTESVIGVVLRTYDGEGNFTQIDNIKGSVTGIVPDREGFGTYEVTGDCLASATGQPAPGIVIVERLVIVDGGDEIRSIATSPLGVMVTSVSRRVTAGGAPAKR